MVSSLNFLLFHFPPFDASRKQLEPVNFRMNFTTATNYVEKFKAWEKKSLFWRRCLATTIDLIVSAIIVMGYFVCLRVLPILTTTPDRVYDSAFPDMETVVWFFLPIAASLWFYHAYSEASQQMGTLGKHCAGLIVTTRDGNRISICRATLRLAAKCVSSMFSFFLLFLFMGSLVLVMSPICYLVSLLKPVIPDAVPPLDPLISDAVPPLVILVYIIIAAILAFIYVAFLVTPITGRINRPFQDFASSTYIIRKTVLSNGE